VKLIIQFDRLIKTKFIKFYTVIPHKAGGTVLDNARTVLTAYSAILFYFFFGC
jgi:hypothetical protein